MAASSAVSSGLASRYATALFELGRAQDAIDPVLRDLSGFGVELEASDELRRVIASPLVSREEHARVMGALAERAGMHPLTRSFLGVLAQNRRLYALPQVITAFREAVARARGEVDAEVVSAQPLDEGQLDAVRHSVAGFAKAPVNLTAKVDPGLLGGIVVRVGSKMVDASLRTKLQQLETSLRGLS